jgi:hypothetical protein
MEAFEAELWNGVATGAKLPGWHHFGVRGFESRQGWAPGIKVFLKPDQ